MCLLGIRNKFFLTYWLHTHYGYDMKAPGQSGLVVTHDTSTSSLHFFLNYDFHRLILSSQFTIPFRSSARPDVSNQTGSAADCTSRRCSLRVQTLADVGLMCQGPHWCRAESFLKPFLERNVSIFHSVYSVPFNCLIEVPVPRSCLQVRTFSDVVSALIHVVRV